MTPSTLLVTGDPIATIWGQMQPGMFVERLHVTAESQAKGNVR